MSNKTLIKSIVVLAAICLVIAGALAVVNSFTAPIISEAAAEREVDHHFARGFLQHYRR